MKVLDISQIRSNNFICENYHVLNLDNSEFFPQEKPNFHLGEFEKNLKIRLQV